MQLIYNNTDLAGSSFPSNTAGVMQPHLLQHARKPADARADLQRQAPGMCWFAGQRGQDTGGKAVGAQLTPHTDLSGEVKRTMETNGRT